MLFAHLRQYGHVGMVTLVFRQARGGTSTAFVASATFNGNLAVNDKIRMLGIE